MGFKAEEFRQQKFSHRTETITNLGGLADFFEGPPEWTLRGLTHTELSTAESMAKKGRAALETIISNILQNPTADAGKQLSDEIGNGKKPDIGTALRIEYLSIGSVDPPVDVRLARKISETHPIEFRQLSDKIMELSGRGQVTEEKLTPSGDDQTLEQVSV